MTHADGETGTRPMGLQNAAFITELTGLSTFLEQQDSLEHSLRELATMVANLLKTENCSIMLLKGEAAGGAPKLRVFAHHGHLPQAAYRESMRLDEGIAGRVAGSGEPLLIPDIRQSDYAAVSRRQRTTPGGFISAPIPVRDKVIGVLNLSQPHDARTLDQEDLKLATIVALLVGKSIQVLQLQNLLRSNFIQLALARETRETPNRTVAEIAHDGTRMARILAKTFFRDMRGAGFATDQILGAATEIISLLSQDLGERRKEAATRAE